MEKREQDEQVRRAKADLTRIEQQSEKIFGATPTQSEFGPDDPIEIWGKRIGRTIGYAVALFLIWHLSTTYFFK